MHLDVTGLSAFYGSTPLGQVGRRVLRQHLRAWWPSAQGRDVLGVGFASPFLGPFVDEAASLSVFMSARQGVMAWPDGRLNRASLVDEGRWPLPDSCIDMLLLIHAVEDSDNLPRLMAEAVRVLRAEGSLVIVAPNRNGLWAWMESTPFGHGRPFSKGQLARLLERNHLQPLQWQYLLYLPPINRRFLARSQKIWEGLGRRLWYRNAGVILVEAQKQVLAAQGKAAARKVRSMIPDLVPSPTQSASRAARDEFDRAFGSDPGLTGSVRYCDMPAKGETDEDGHRNYQAQQA